MIDHVSSSPLLRPPPRAAERSTEGAIPRAEQGAVAGGINAREAQSSDAQRAQLQALRARDQEVRAHEHAHAAVAGAFARGGPQYTYARGPDGQLYAVGGEVAIDAAPVAGDPQATLEKAEQIRRAALAPAQPSAQDQAVAAQASAMAAQARAELQANDGGPGTRPDDAATPNAAACPSCGGQHGPGAHGEQGANTVEQAYRAHSSSADVTRSLLIAIA